MAKTKGNTEFKHRLNTAVATVRADLNLIATHSQRLFTPRWDDRHYRWSVLMDSDGTFVSERQIHDGEAHAPTVGASNLYIGVIVQSEFTTSLTKPNPIGKASVGLAPLGVWVDLADGQRVRLDRVFVLFILPQSAAVHHHADFVTTQRNVMNAASAVRDSGVIIVPRGINAAALAEHLTSQVRGWLNGVGRPRTTT